jgi:hypothetical protein
MAMDIPMPTTGMRASPTPPQVLPQKMHIANSLEKSYTYTTPITSLNGFARADLLIEKALYATKSQKVSYLASMGHVGGLIA